MATPVPSLFPVRSVPPWQLMDLFTSMVDRHRALPEPQNPFLVRNTETPAAGQLTDEAYLRAVAFDVAGSNPLGSESDSEAEVAMALQLLATLLDGMRWVCSLEAITRSVLELDPHAPYDAAAQIAPMAARIQEEIRRWTDDLEPLPGDYTADSQKRAALSSAAITVTGNIASLMSGVSNERPLGSTPSTTGLGRRVHKFVQLAYVTEHPVDHVICDGRWYYTQMSVIVSRLLDALTENEVAANYTHKIMVFRQAMRLPDGTSVRPDITNLDLDEAYEIKSRSESHEGFRELHGFYLPQYDTRAAALGLPPLHGGFWLPPAVFYDLAERAVVVISNVGQGVIVYDVFRVPTDVINGLVGLAIGMAMLNEIVRKIGQIQLPPLPVPGLTDAQARELAQTVSAFLQFLAILVLLAVAAVMAAFALRCLLPLPA